MFSLSPASIYAIQLPFAPRAKMINGGSTMRSISWGPLEAERWSVLLYWTLRLHSKPWPGLWWFITRAAAWSLYLQPFTLAPAIRVFLSIFFLLFWGGDRGGIELCVQPQEKRKRQKQLIILHCKRTHFLCSSWLEIRLHLQKISLPLVLVC